MQSSKPRVFVSYKWSVEDTTQILERLAPFCAERGIELIRDRDTLKQGDLISEFMEELVASDHIITVFSQAYLESEYCMTELLRIYQRNGKNNFHTRIHPIVADKVLFSDVDTQIKYIKHWREKETNLANELAGIESTDSIRLIERQKIYQDIARELNNLMAFAGDILVKPINGLEQENFAPLLDRIQPTIPKTSKQAYQVSDQEYLDKIIKSIATDLKNSSVFTDNIIAEIQVPEDEHDLTEYLVNLCKDGKMYEVIQGLQGALCESIYFMEDNATPAVTIAKELKIASALLTKLLLFSVRDEWMQQHLKTVGTQEHPNCQLPEMDLRHIEIVNNRQFQILPESNTEVKIQKEVAGVRLESGIEDGNKRNRAVREALKQLYEIVLKGDPVTDLKQNSFVTEGCKYIEGLKETIMQRRYHPNWKLRKSYFMAISSRSDIGNLDIESQKIVAELIPELQWIVLKSGDSEQVLVLPDKKLKILVDEFYRILGE